MELDMRELEARIEKLLLDYVAVRSDTNTEFELSVDSFFSRWFDTVPYFNQNPGHCGHYAIPGDHLGRSVNWCMREGDGDDTVVLIHHYDCVDTEVYGVLRDLALKPYELEKQLLAGKLELDDECISDLHSGQWLFGRGVNDMKAGGAIQLALMESYCAREKFKGNVLLIAVPDEENLSAGMRGACSLLKELSDKHGLRYVMMLNSEPHERTDGITGSLYDGAIGKVMPLVYVKGKLSHVGNVYDGFNPINLLSEIVRRTELSPSFIERVGNTTSPAPAWLYSRDQKPVYDVSLPAGACGCLSVLPLEKTPMEIMEMIKELSVDAFDDVISDMNDSYTKYLEISGETPQKLPWEPRVCYFSEIYSEALRDGGEEFELAYNGEYQRVKKCISSKEISVTQGAISLIEVTLKYVKNQSPVAVLAIAPPYYPSVNNSFLKSSEAKANAAVGDLIDYAQDSLDERYEVLNYFTGICDLSYAMFKGEHDNIEYIKDNMLLWGEVYSIPLEIISELSMPVLNIGPWGKGLHKNNERVNKKDLFYNTPRMADFMIGRMLCSNNSY